MEDFGFVDASTGEISAEMALVQIAAIPEYIQPKLRSLPTSLNASKDEIRTSLKASTLDGVFAAVFSNVTGGVLLTNFLLKLGASPTEIGILAAIPMLANLMQPLGAYLSEQTNSRHNYCLWVYGLSRSLFSGLARTMLPLIL